MVARLFAHALITGTKYAGRATMPHAKPIVRGREN
jgi:hypothetical protein